MRSKRRNLSYIQEYAILILAISIFFMPHAIGIYIAHRNSVKNQTRVTILDHFSQNGTSKIIFKKKSEAENFKKEANNLGLKNIKKISIKDNGENFEVIVEFKSR